MWPDTGCEPDDRGTWTKPSVRLPGYDCEPFRTVARMPELGQTFDTLVGPGRWVRKDGLEAVAVRYPHPDPPNDDYWHGLSEKSF
ncbi:hypothetical protein DFR76_102503 [Nocardia pseudobrasiliensis]|uniref:Uncharacterized protein n=1 Tax=Nocardia pseudobrasiliensis TaxID=45979 RepID=A0A370IBK6_9NOCA|nr:hypothetical protein DFR76_102503 [Nocardia pseudobrasiliensis]